MHKLEVLKTMKLCLKVSYLVSLFHPKKQKKNPKKTRQKKAKKQKQVFLKQKLNDKKFNESRCKFYELKIKEIRENLYEIENENNLSESKIKEIEKNLTELEDNISKTKKYYDYDDSEYRGIRDVRGLFDLSIDED